MSDAQVQAPTERSSTIPVGVLAERSEEKLRIEWSDGHTSVYEFAYLRAHCPCQGCSEGEGQSPSVSDGDVGVAAVSMVGSSALLIAYDDGHDGGIYTFQFLRSICPCGDHEAEAT